MQPLLLKIYHNGSLIKAQPFTDDQISIGSGEGLTVQLEGISPWHILIEKKLDRYIIFDLGSDQGTFIDGEKITGEVELASGTKITIGDYDIEFFIGLGQQTEEVKAPKPKKEKPAPKVQAAASKKKSPKAAVPSIHGNYQKPKKKGFWNTYAPPSKIKNLDDEFEASVGNLIEVSVAWKDRILFSKYFYKNGHLHVGSSPDCEIQVPNMLNSKKYKFASIKGSTKVHLHSGIKASLIQGKDKSTRTVTPLTSAGSVNVKPYEIVKLDFSDTVQLYIRTVSKQRKAPLVGLLNFNFSETVGFVLASLLTAFLVFYVAFYAPNFLLEKDKFLEKDIIRAKVVFQKRTSEIMKYRLSDKTAASSTKTVKKKAKKKILKKVSFPKKVKPKKRPRIINLPNRKKKKSGKAAAQAPGKKRSKKKVSVGSVRPGGSLKTGKSGSSAKTKAPDPTKVGLLGVFGGGGAQNKLDKGASGSGGLMGLAQQSTGFAGTEESYGGQGVGTKTKELGSGGKGTSLVGISGIKTKGRGRGTSGKGLGSRGKMEINFNENDVEFVGEIDRAGILERIRKNKVKFDSCYQFSLQKKASAQGSLKMQWDIQPNGSVSVVQAIDDRVGSKHLRDCVAGVLRNINFPSPPSGQIARVAFKFVFSI